MTEPTQDRPLADFLARTQDVLSLAERRLIVGQALLMLEQNYVHLPLKAAMHGINPLQRLRVMLARMSTQAMVSERDFHAELLEIFHSLRDLHTNYLVPSPYGGLTAYLPFLIEECFQQEDVHYLVTALAKGYTPPEGFGPGVEVTHWNDIPIERAIRLNAAKYAGSNAAARYARGLETLTLRPLMRHLPPDEEVVTLRYHTRDGHTRTVSEVWRVSQNPPLPDPDILDEAALTLAYDLHGAVLGAVKADLFAGEDATGIEVIPEFRTFFRARSVTTAAGEFGHLRIWSFLTPNAPGFVDEFARLIRLLPQTGLIVDVRGNGGGSGPGAESLLQMLTPRRIEPEPIQFINTPLNKLICDRVRGLEPWRPSMRQALETGSTFSAAFPLTDPEMANDRGQIYHGPVVLITDARCYSATDIFAAGFQDHGIGPVLGTDDVTGAGGANVWTHQLLTSLMDPEPGEESPYRSLPGGAGMRVAIRRTLRVGPSSGTPVEDLGIHADERHLLTPRDVIGGNADLIERAGRILAGLEGRRLDLDSVAGGTATLTVAGLDRLDVYADGRPQASKDVADGQVTIQVPAAGTLLLEGYRKGELVAARRVDLTRATTG
ncbi:S41 family peptidase [Nonomuraea sp. NPDC050536]|uniref:S41 family peptidase n=1 Tax=Nonomuraea sp. NPDC050536 TaxID=3364366 RepID=UPI0037C5FDC6